MKTDARMLMAAITAILLGGMSLSGCKKEQAVLEDKDSDLPALSVRPPRISPDPPKPVIAEAAPAATPVPRLPENVYFLVASVPVETPDGITRLLPGTPLKRVSPGVYESGGNKMELRDDQVTNDVRVAERVAGADQAAQAALRQMLRANAMAERMQQQAGAAAAIPAPAPPVESASAPPPPPEPSTPDDPSNPLQRGSYGKKYLRQ